MLTLHIEDDGSGLPAERASQIPRGRRWDEEQPGTGFGLAITQELAQGYQGTLELGRSDWWVVRDRHDSVTWLATKRRPLKRADCDLMT